MAKDVERLVLELSADVSRLERGMRQGQRIAENRTRAIEKSFDQMNRRTTASVNDMGANIRNAIAGIAVGAAVREVQQYADAWTRMSNPLRAAGADQATVNAQMEELVGISLRSRSSLEGTVTLYNRLIASSGELGVSQERVARVVETVNKALATSNLSTGERTSAVTQLAQGLGSGTLAGDELKAIRENSIVLAQAIADEFDTTIGGLKKLGEEGVLTSARVFAAIENAQVGTDAAFARTTATIGDAFTNLETRTTQFIGQLDASTGASAKFAAVVEFVANNLDEIATAAGYVAVAVGTGYATAMTIAGVRTALATVSNLAYQASLIRMMAAQTGATAAQVALNGAMAANPVGLVVVAVAALATGLVALNQRFGESAVAARRLDDTVTATDKALEEYETAARAAANATAENRREMNLAAAAALNEARSRVTATNVLYEELRVRAALRAEAARVAEAQASGPGAGLSGPSYSPGLGAGTSDLASRRADQQEAAAKIAADAAKARLESIIADAARGFQTAGGGAGGGAGAASTGGRAAAAVSDEAERVKTLREEVDRLAYDILTDTEKAAVDLAKVRDTLRAAVEIGRLTPAQAAALEGGFAAQGMTLTGDASLNPLDNNAGFLAEQLSGGRAATQKRFDEQGQEMARGFIEILSADDIGTEIGNRFRAAAFDGLEKVLGNLFSQLFASQGGGAGGGNIWAAAASAIFGGNRALGGPVRAGMAYRVNENTPNSEIFVPNRDGWVGNMKQPRGGGRSVQNVTVTNELYLAGANGDAVIYGNVRAMLAASQRQTVAAIKAGAPAAQLEQTLLRE
jgi:tape measure domain-containing protein